MPEDDQQREEQQQDEQQNDDASRARERRARLARIFGDVLPETTGDERSDRGSGRPDDWYTSERPPHHS